MKGKNLQVTNTILMIRPVQFDYNPETAINNYYQTPSDRDNNNSIQEKALLEFDNFVQKLRDINVHIIVVEDTIFPPTPDSIFPNNWVSFHSDGKVGLYPMFAKNRRLERRTDILDTLKNMGFTINKINDYSKDGEDSNIFLEGTGSMVLDRNNKKAYCALSPRGDIKLLKKFCKDFGYTPLPFKAYQWAKEQRLSIYHTNVMLAIGENFAIICTSSIDDPEERETILSSLRDDNKEIIDISEEQVECFCGNALQIKNRDEERFLVLSKTAYGALTNEQIKVIEKSSKIIIGDVPTIQKYGGGSVRCMMAEVFLPESFNEIL